MIKFRYDLNVIGSYPIELQLFFEHPEINAWTLGIDKVHL